LPVLLSEINYKIIQNFFSEEIFKYDINAVKTRGQSFGDLVVFKDK